MNMKIILYIKNDENTKIDLGESCEFKKLKKI